MFKKLFLTAIVLSTMSLVFAQDDVPSIFAEALRMEEEKFNDLAGDFWMELHNIEPDNANFNYRLGLSYLNSNKNKLSALKYLKLIPDGDYSMNYNYYDDTEKKAPIESMYYLAHAYHLNNMVDSAIAVYERFSAKVSKKHFMRPEIDHQIKMCENAKIQFANPVDYTITNLGSEINSEFGDFGPVISLDESSLFFTSNRIRKDSSNWNAIDLSLGNYYNDVYVSYKDFNTDQWNEPELLNLNDLNAHTATINVSPDGQRLFLYINDLTVRGVFESQLIGETWGEPEKFGGEVNLDAWETHVALSADGNSLYFVNETDDGYGKRDLYSAVRLPNGEWSKALNLGDVINSEWDEEAPFVHPDGKTLYFSSQGHNSIGGYDIFYTTMQEDGTWSEPQNVGYPVNTTDDDIFFVTTADGRRAYYSSTRSGGYGSDDIYLIGLPENVTQGLAVLKGYIYPTEGQLLPNDLSIEVTNVMSGIIKVYRPRMRDGGYVIILPPCQEYIINYFQGEQSIHKENYFVPCESSYQEINKEIFLNPIEVGGVASVVDSDSDKGADTGIDETKIGTRTNKELLGKYERHFAYNKKNFSPKDQDFKSFINSVKEALKKYEYVEITIEGSASKVPTKTYGTNDKLANLRATDAEALLLKALDDNNISRSNVRIVAINSLTQGPDYKYDAVKNRKVYEQYQYVIIKAY